MTVNPERYNIWSPNAAHLSAQIMNLPYKDFNESSPQYPERLTSSAYNMFKMLGSTCNACICKICEYLKGQKMPTSAIRCDCKPCNCKQCTGSVTHFETANIELRLRYKNKFRNELDHVKIKSRGRPCSSINCCKDRVRSSSSYMSSQREEGKQKTFRSSTVTVAPVEEGGPLENCRCSPCSCDDCTQRGLTIPCNQTHEMSTGINRRTNCPCDDCSDNSCQPNTTNACKCAVRRGVFRKPTERYIQDYDIHSATVENKPLIIKGKRPDKNDSISIYGSILPCISGTCQCKNKNPVNSQMGLSKTSKPQKLRAADPRLCQCMQCECLACSFPKQTTLTESLESLRTCAMCNHIGDKWKGRFKLDEQRNGIQVPKKGSIRVVQSPAKTIIKDDRISEKQEFNHGFRTNYDAHVTPCRCSKHNNLFQKTHIKEMLDNVYSDLEIEEHNKNSNKFSVGNLNRIPSGQLIHGNYEVCTLVNSETNTENPIANKCIETDSYTLGKKKFAENKVRNYEYTLRIEIMTPNLNETKEATKQKIKKDTKKGVKEQTRRVVRDLFSDISKTSLFIENSTEHSKALRTADEERLENVESSEHNNMRSILKQNISSSKAGEESTIQIISTTALPPSTKSKGTMLDDCFFVRCLTPVHHTTSQKTGKVIQVSKMKIPSKDDNTGSLTSTMQYCSMSMGKMQNEWTQIFPVVAKTSTITPVNSMGKLNSCAKVESIQVRDLDELRIQEPCVRRVSDHTVSLKWKLPKALEDVLGYEILVDGKTIEKIFNPTRCLAVVSCLPPVGRILITIRTITKTPGAPGLFPCTTIGYQPRANKTICI